jgi:hypothetical protein
MLKILAYSRIQQRSLEFCVSATDFVLRYCIKQKYETYFSDRFH